MIVQCPYCHYREAVPEEYAGMIGECSKCGKEFRITSPTHLQKTRSNDEHPVISFVLGFFFSLIGILVAYVIDKRNVEKAVMGFLASIVILVLCSIVLYRTNSVGRKIAEAASAISAEEGGKAKASIEDINENTIEDIIKRLGE